VAEVEDAPVAPAEAPVREARAPRIQRDEPRPARDVLPDLPSAPGEWNGPVPGFLNFSAL